MTTANALGFANRTTAEKLPPVAIVVTAAIAAFLAAPTVANLLKPAPAPVVFAPTVPTPAPIVPSPEPVKLAPAPVVHVHKPRPVVHAVVRRRIEEEPSPRADDVIAPLAGLAAGAIISALVPQIRGEARTPSYMPRSFHPFNRFGGFPGFGGGRGFGHSYGGGGFGRFGGGMSFGHRGFGRF